MKKGGKETSQHEWFKLFCLSDKVKPKVNWCIFIPVGNVHWLNYRKQMLNVEVTNI